MSHPLNSLIDLALHRAQESGAFDDLPGAGKPIPGLGDGQPKDAVVHRILKEAQVKPPAVLLQQQITAGWKHLKTLTDEEDRKAEMKKLSDLQMRLSIEQEAYRRFG